MTYSIFSHCQLNKIKIIIQFRKGWGRVAAPPAFILSIPICPDGLVPSLHPVGRTLSCPGSGSAR